MRRNQIIQNISKKSLISFILGIFCCITRLGFILFIPGILFGIGALSDIKKSHKMIKGGYFAIFGISLSLMGFLLNLRVAIPSINEQKERSNILKVKSDMVLIRSALEKYYIENNCYPLWETEQKGINSHIGSWNISYHINTFRIWKLPKVIRSFRLLTTPISYIKSFPYDPFASKDCSYGYYSDDKGWILFSPGPDRKYDIVPNRDYSSGIIQPSQKIVENSYDVTNGIISHGDIVEFKR